jgi:hypothetical protein
VPILARIGISVVFLVLPNKRRLGLAAFLRTVDLFRRLALFRLDWRRVGQRVRFKVLSWDILLVLLGLRGYLWAELYGLLELRYRLKVLVLSRSLILLVSLALSTLTTRCGLLVHVPLILLGILDMLGVQTPSRLMWVASGLGWLRRLVLLRLPRLLWRLVESLLLLGRLRLLRLRSLRILLRLRVSCAVGPPESLLIGLLVLLGDLQWPRVLKVLLVRTRGIGVWQRR